MWHRAAFKLQCISIFTFCSNFCFNVVPFFYFLAKLLCNFLAVSCLFSFYFSFWYGLRVIMSYYFVNQCRPRNVALGGETLTASAYEPGYDRLSRTTNEPISLSSSIDTATITAANNPELLLVGRPLMCTTISALSPPKSPLPLSLPLSLSVCVC